MPSKYYDFMPLAEHLILLGATAGLTGVLVPLIKGNLDHRKLLDGKRFEAELARETKILEAQGALLERLTQLLWAQALRVVEVSYRAYRGEIDAQKAAWERYDSACWTFFIDTRAEISKARQLSSDQVCDNLDRLYARFVSVDETLDLLVKAPSQAQDKWKAFHVDAVGPLSTEIEGSLRMLAHELKLAVHR